MPEAVVVDASAIVDLLVGSENADALLSRLRDHALHAPAHLDAEVLSALGRLHRSKRLTAGQVADRLERFAAAPIERHALAPLLAGSWARRHRLGLLDAVYVELSDRLGAALITSDARLAAAAPAADLIER